MKWFSDEVEETFESIVAPLNDICDKLRNYLSTKSQEEMELVDERVRIENDISNTRYEQKKAKFTLDKISNMMPSDKELDNL